MPKLTSLSLRLVLLVSPLLWPGALAHAEPPLSKGDRARLDRGTVLEYSQKVPGTSVMMGKAIGVINDVPEAVLHVLLQFNKYKHFLPRVKASRITRRRGWVTYAVIHTDLPWPVKDSWVYLRVRRRDRPRRVYHVKWKMLNGTMKEYRGEAVIKPWAGNGKRTLISYMLQAEPATSAPDSLISKGVRRVAGTIVKRFRLRVAALRKFKKMPRGL